MLCINSVKETCFSQKYQKCIYQVLEINSSIVSRAHYVDLIKLKGKHINVQHWDKCMRSRLEIKGVY